MQGGERIRKEREGEMKGRSGEEKKQKCTISKSVWAKEIEREGET